MSNSETLYTFRDAFPNVLGVDRAQTVRMEVRRDGALAAPTAVGSTYSLFDPGGQTAIVNAQPISVVGGIALFVIPAATLPTTLALGEGYFETWDLLLADGTQREIRREASLAIRELYPVLAEIDLEGEYPDITFALGQVLTSYQPFIDEAWKRIINRLIREGVLTYLVMSPTAFRDVHRELTFYLMFKWFFMHQGQESRWMELFKSHLAAYEAEWGKLNFVFDADHDGFADSSERVGTGGVTHVNPAPRRRLQKSSRW